MKIEDSLELFDPIIGEWFSNRFQSPTDIQSKAWKKISEGDHVLISAPTGSGKTLTAFLWALNSIIGNQEKPTKRILYISPLKALNNDIYVNLKKPLAELEEIYFQKKRNFRKLNISVRSGDSSAKERRDMIKNPPDILITTPESLNVLLTSEQGRSSLANFGTVILDEIHAIADSKRGVWLMSAIERLANLYGEFQRIAISATINPVQLIEKFIGGYQLIRKSDYCEYRQRKVTTIKSQISKNYKLQLNFPFKKIEEKQTDWWQLLSINYKDLINKSSSSLFFSNSRRTVEKLSRLLNLLGLDDVYSHHGSLSREIRVEVERKFRNGELSAIIATNSLELGIDIGSVDQVILIQPPQSISSAIQRIGRSGHGVGQTSVGIFSPTNSHDLLESFVLAKYISAEHVEKIKLQESPLDVLIQIILSMGANDYISIDQIYQEIRCCYNYYQLSKEHFTLVIDMLSGKYKNSQVKDLNPKVYHDKLNRKIKTRSGSRLSLYMSGGVIPDRGYYSLRDKSTMDKIGELDEEFVWERSIGDAFPFGNRIWKIVRITHNDVEVVPASVGDSVLPFWRAADFNRSFDLSSKIAMFLEMAEHNLDSNQIYNILKEGFETDTDSVQNLVSYLQNQRKYTQAALPHRHHILVEHYHDPSFGDGNKQIIFHTFWGGRVNKPFALCVSQAWKQKYGNIINVYSNNDCIILNTPPEIEGKEILNMIPTDQVNKLIEAGLESTGYFGALFRENSQRALLLPKRHFNKRMPFWMSRIRSKNLLKSISQFSDFPIVIETWKQCLNHEFELDTLKKLIQELKNEEISISEIRTSRPSPFASGIVWKHVNHVMYEDDQVGDYFQSNIDKTLIDGIVNNRISLPSFSRKLLLEFKEKIQRTSQFYSPYSAEELLLWLKQRLFIPLKEWESILQAMHRDHQLEIHLILEELSDHLIFIGEINHPLGVMSKEVAADFSQILSTNNINIKFQDSDIELFRHFISEWLNYYGPITLQEISDNFKFDLNRIYELLTDLSDEGQVLLGDLLKNGEQSVCSVRNLEMLLYLKKNQKHAISKRITIDQFQYFLALRSGLSRAKTPDQGNGLESIMDPLLGIILKSEIWETDILPARINDYSPKSLDQLMFNYPLQIFGSEGKKHGFCFDTDWDLYIGNRAQTKLSGKGVLLLKIFQEYRGKLDLLFLLEKSDLLIKDLTETLWELFWNGWISNENMTVLRKAILNGYRSHQLNVGNKRLGRRSFGRSDRDQPQEGLWFLIDFSAISERDISVIDEFETVKDRVRQLLVRYGVIFRELLTHELPMLKWGRIFAALRIMELSGELISGKFIEGVNGIQFCTAKVFKQIQEMNSSENIYWMNAVDPVSLCGKGIQLDQNPLPKRIDTTHLVFHGARLVMISKKNGKEIIFYEQPSSPAIIEYLTLFQVLVSRKFKPLKRIKTEIINGESAESSPYIQIMRNFGFTPEHKHLVYQKQYEY